MFRNYSARLVLAACLISGAIRAADVPAPVDNLTDFRTVLRWLRDDSKKEGAAKAFLELIDAQVKAAKKPYLVELKKNVDSADANVRKSAIQSIVVTTECLVTGGKIAAEIVPPILGKAEAPKKTALDRLASMLEGILEHEHYNALIDELASDKPDVVAAVAKKLQDKGAEAAEYLALFLDDERGSVKRGVADILKAMGPAAKEAAPDIAGYLDSDDKLARRLAVQILENLGPDAAGAIDDLVRNLDHEDKTVRKISSTILKKIGPAVKEAAEDIAGYLDSDEKSVRMVAMDVLTNLGANGKDATERLGDYLDDGVSDNDTKTRAATILGSIGPAAKETLSKLKKMAEDQNATLSAAAKAAIERIEKK